MMARSFLFVPGDREDMLAKAAGRGADALIIDLEDAVAVSAKDEARGVVRRWLSGGVPGVPGGVWVRVNNEPGLLGDDLTAISGSGVAGVLLPKVETPEQLDSVAAIRVENGLRIVAMIESAAGVLNAGKIAASNTVDRLAVGEVDLAADLGMRPGADGIEFLPIRMLLVVVSAAEGLPSPIGPVYTDFHDVDGLRRSSEDLRGHGLWSRFAIHPAQVAVINEAFTPTSSEVSAARRLIDRFEQAEAEGRGVCVDEEGRMIDEAVVRSARRVAAAGDIAGI